MLRQQQTLNAFRSTWIHPLSQNRMCILLFRVVKLSARHTISCFYVFFVPNFYCLVPLHALWWIKYCKCLSRRNYRNLVWPIFCYSNRIRKIIFWMYNAILFCPIFLHYWWIVLCIPRLITRAKVFEIHLMNWKTL